jgi:ribose transport system ATP-binding protein
MEASNGNILEMHGIFKVFPGVIALNDVNLEVKRGSVHGLVGENGAGKSTLIKIISGEYKKDRGSFYFDNREIIQNDPNRAESMGIFVVPQTVSYFKYLTIAENIFIDNMPMKGCFVDRRKLYRDTMEWIEKFNLELKPFEIMENLSFVHKKVVLILKALSKKSKLIILDEPTASLHRDELEKLFSFIKEFKDAGITIIYISHYLEEVFRVCEEITILKDGKVVASGEVKKFSMDTIVENMIGRELKEGEYFNEVDHTFGNTILEVKGITNKSNSVRNISFSLKRGEVLSIAGIKGSGKEELVNILFGLASKKSGTITLDGENITSITTQLIFKKGMFYLPEDRFAQGLFDRFSVAQNISFCAFKRIVNKLGFFSNPKEINLAEKYKKDLNILTPRVQHLVKFLSGGNQQKVVFSKILAGEPTIILLHGPTVGIDVGSKSEIYKIIENLARSGISIILVTEEINEILNLSDRVLIIYKGELIKTINRIDKDFNVKDITLYMENGING